MTTGKKEEKVVSRPKDPSDFDHLSKEERFLLFVVPAMGTARAAKCLILDTAKAEAAWKDFSSTAIPVNLN